MNRQAVITPPSVRSAASDGPAARRSGALSRWLYSRPRVRLGALLVLPLAWLGVLYIGSLLLLFATAFWRVDTFTSKVQPAFTLDNFVRLATEPAYQATALRTIGISLAVTLLCAAVALPLGLYMAKVASRRVRTLLAIGIALPLWAGYLVKVYSWRISFTTGGPLDWLLRPFGLDAPGYGTGALVVTLAYLWFPFMAVPVYSALRQIPENLFEASSDLGGRSWATVRHVALPLLKPALIAGSIFTFSLSLGDYIAAQFVGGKTQVIGTVIASNINLNPPLAAAFSMVPLAVVVLYLLAARRSGALKHF
ncbi:ABC transporter permease [Zhihengliuella sp.]|uniref:ABC transporter permease n=1 Tax=Zhihengliuella sp. TaxID=1954483 RepID=UPI002810F171|nr:ABC transporter permease [Zhihengliuella sp.]